MPRLPPSLVLQARHISRLLPPILQTTRALQPAINELRWLTEHVADTKHPRASPLDSRRRLLRFVRRRARGEPLQYILGSQPFGDLDIKCKKGVLIPRPETEAYVQHLTDRISSGDIHFWIKSKFIDSPSTGDAKRRPALRVLDACSGSGCISLLTYSQLRRKFPFFSVTGIDISQKAIELANENVKRNTSLLTLSTGRKAEAYMKPKVSFIQRDVFDPFPPSMYDIIICNPPYISPKELAADTEKSVRLWEPRDALVPKIPSHYIPGIRAPHDVFYLRLMEVHHDTFCKVMLMEVGDAAQAVRVLQHAVKTKDIAENNRFEIWRDDPAQPLQEGATDHIMIDKFRVPILGAGKVRAVLLYRTQNFTPESGDDYYVKHLYLGQKELRPEPERKAKSQRPKPHMHFKEPDTAKDPLAIRRHRQKYSSALPTTPQQLKYNSDTGDQATSSQQRPKADAASSSKTYMSESDIPEGVPALPKRTSHLRRKDRAQYLRLKGQLVRHDKPEPQPKPQVSDVLHSRPEETSKRAKRGRYDPLLDTRLKSMASGWRSLARGRS